MTAPTTLQKFSSLLLLGLVLILPVQFLVLEPLSQIQMLKDKRKNNQSLMTGLAAIAAQEEPLKDTLDLVQSGAINPDFFLNGPTDSVIAASLQKTINQQARLNRLKVVRVQSLTTNPTPETTFQKVGVRTLLEGRLSNLVSLLHHLETVKPYLFVNRMDLVNRRPVNNDPVSASNPILQISLDLYGVRPLSATEEDKS